MNIKAISRMKLDDGREIILADHLTREQAYTKLDAWMKKYPNAFKVECKDGYIIINDRGSTDTLYRGWNIYQWNEKERVGYTIPYLIYDLMLKGNHFDTLKQAQEKVDELINRGYTPNKL